MSVSHIFTEQGLIRFKYGPEWQCMEVWLRGGNVSLQRANKQNQMHHHWRISRNSAQALRLLNSLLSIPV